MEQKPYHAILENLKNQKEAEIDRLISLREQESFYIDYKVVSTTFPTNRLSDDDRKNYAKAISGFSNTSGGLLVWGIADDFSKREINEPDDFVRLLNSEVSTLTLPARKEVNSFSIKLANGKGYVVTEIPKYYFSPVQVVTKVGVKDISFKYFIRSGSSFEAANHDLISGLYNRQQSSRLICCWETSGEGDYIESEDSATYRIRFIVQNKGPGVLRDVWVNYTAGGLKTLIEKTDQTDTVFQGWRPFNDVLNLISKDDYKCGPQHFLRPFIIHITLNKEPRHEESYLYLSYGADKVSPSEIDIKFKKSEVKEFFAQENRSCTDFLRRFGLGKSG